MNREVLSICLISAVITAFPSCSVKEDRSRCPSLLQLDMTPCKAHTRTVSVTACDGDVLFRHRYVPGVTPDTVEYDVPRELIRVYALNDGESPILGGPSVVVQPGCQFDSLFSCSHDVDADCESVYDMIRLHKQFASLTLDLTGLLPIQSNCNMEICGNVIGYDVMDMMPIGGQFSFMMEECRDQRYNVLLPRQKDDSLGLVIHHGGERKSYYPIGEYLRDAGYDWYAEDLADAVVTIKTIEAGVSVQITEWLTGFVWDVVL